MAIKFTTRENAVGGPAATEKVTASERGVVTAAPKAPGETPVVGSDLFNSETEAAARKRKPR